MTTGQQDRQASQETVPADGVALDPAAPAAMVALFVAGWVFLDKYLMPAMNTILSTPWFLEVFPDQEASP